MTNQDSTRLPIAAENIDPAAPAAPVHKADSNDDLSLFLDMPDLEGLEFLLDEIEDQIAPLA